MNELAERTVNLPDTIEDLTQFVLVGKAKLNAYMLKLQTINKLSVAQEIREQTLKETQELNAALFAAEQRIGELLLAIPKQSGASNFSRDVEKLKTKSETIKDMGYSKDEASDYQRMAKNPDIVQKVLEEAVANGTVATRTQVMKEIRKADESAREAVRQELAEKDRQIRAQEAKIRELQNQPPKVREITKEPDDYAKVKRLNKAYAENEKNYMKQISDLNRDNRKLQEENEKIRKQTALEQNNMSLTASALAFVQYVRNFLESIGGYVIVTQEWANIPGKEREGFKQSAEALRDFGQLLLDDIEGGAN